MINAQKKMTPFSLLGIKLKRNADLLCWIVSNSISGSSQQLTQASMLAMMVPHFLFPFLCPSSNREIFVFVLSIFLHSVQLNEFLSSSHFKNFVADALFLWLTCWHQILCECLLVIFKKMIFFLFWIIPVWTVFFCKNFNVVDCLFNQYVAYFSSKHVPELIWIAFFDFWPP